MRLRSVAVPLSIGLLLLGAGECGVRRFAPQDAPLVMLRGASLAVPDPVLGHRNRAGAIAVQTSPEFRARYEINAQGLRDASPHPPGAGAPRLLLLGDSFTFGYANPYEDIWPVRLEQELARRGLRTDCVKAGVPGYDTRVEALYLPEALAAYRPDVVLLILLPNDLVTNRPLSAPDALAAPSVVRPQDKPVALHLPMLLARGLMHSDAIYALLYRWTGREQLFRTDEPALAGAWPTTERLLTHIAGTCRTGSARLVLVSMPQRFQVLAAARGARREELDLHAIDRRLEAWGRASGVPVVALLDGLAADYARAGAPLYHALDGHLTARGNEVVGKILAGALLPQLSALVRVAGFEPATLSSGG